MPSAGLRRGKLVPTVAILLGVGAIGTAFAADYLGVGEASGFGSKQILLTAGGVLTVIIGVLLLTNRGQNFLAEPEQARDPMARLSFGSLLITAVWFGLVTGLPEAVLVLAQQLSGHRAIILADYAAWMPPVTYIGLFCIIGAVLALLSLVGWRAAIRFKTVILGFCLLSMLSLLFLLEAELHIVAIGLLAAGLGLQAARVLSWRPTAFLRLARRTVVPLVLLFIAVGVALPVSQSISERMELARLAKPPQGAPNVLLIILDTVRSPSLSLYGYARPTSPGLEGLAEESVVFDRAFSTAPWTLPSHGSLFTGYYVHNLSTDWGTPLDDTHPTLAEFFRDRGYLTAGFVANRVYTGPGSGLDRGFIHYDADVVSASEILRSSTIARYVAEQSWFQNLVGYGDDLGRKRAETVTGEFLDWLDGAAGAPFFVFLNYYDAHDPYLPRQPYEEAFRTTEQTCTLATTSAQVLRAERDLSSCVDGYDGSIAELDHYLDGLLEALDNRGVLDNTLLVVTSDHGEQFGDHGLASHGRSLYLPSLWVPLLVRFPDRAPRGVRVSSAVTLRDIPATIVDLSAAAADHPFPGQSLARHWNRGSSEEPAAGISAQTAVLSETSARRWLPAHNPVSRGDMRSIIARGRHYIVNGDGEVELYDIEADPWEEEDLADLSSSQETLARFAAVLLTLVGEGATPQAQPDQ